MDSKSNINSFEETEEIPCKRLKIIENTEDEQIKITDLNDDCIEHIYEYLDLRDLLNVALSNTRLQCIADVVFERKYDELGVVASKDKLELEFDEGSKLQIDLAEFQDLLLVFGDLIFSIELEYVDHENRKYKKMFEKVFDAITSHSLENLVEFKFHNIPKGWLNKFTKPLPKVERVYFDDCQLGEKTLLLSDIFPKLGYLNKLNYRNLVKFKSRSISNGWFNKSSKQIQSVQRSHFDDRTFPLSQIFPKLIRLNVLFFNKNVELNQIITHVPHLKAINMYMLKECRSTKVESLLNLNPQITKLRLCGSSSFDWKLIRFIAENLQLEEFQLFSVLKGLPDNEHFKIHFKTLKRFTYHNKKSEFPFTFEQLEELDLIHLRSCNQLDEIIKQNGKLTKMSLYINDQNWNSIKLSKELKKLQKITFNVLWSQDKIKAEAIVEYLNEKLPATSIAFRNGEESSVFQNDLQEKEWNINSNGELIFEL